MMKHTLWIIAMLLLLGLFLVPSSRADAATSQVTVPLNHFGDTCTQERVDSSGVLHAWCTRKDGSTNFNAALGLDAFIGNINGIMTSNQKFFVESCPSFSLSGTTLAESCKNRAGNHVSSTCNLNEKVVNIIATL